MMHKNIRHRHEESLILRSSKSRIELLMCYYFFFQKKDARIIVAGGYGSHGKQIVCAVSTSHELKGVLRKMNKNETFLKFAHS